MFFLDYREVLNSSLVSTAPCNPVLGNPCIGVKCNAVISTYYFLGILNYGLTVFEVRDSEFWVYFDVGAREGVLQKYFYEKVQKKLFF